MIEMRTIDLTVEVIGIDHIPEEIDRSEDEEITIAPMEEIMINMKVRNIKLKEIKTLLTIIQDRCTRTRKKKHQIINCT